jgi:hypothetical protein
MYGDSKKYRECAIGNDADKYALLCNCLIISHLPPPPQLLDNQAVASILGRLKITDYLNHDFNKIFKIDRILSFYTQYSTHYIPAKIKNTKKRKRLHFQPFGLFFHLTVEMKKP